MTRSEEKNSHTRLGTHVHFFAEYIGTVYITNDCKIYMKSKLSIHRGQLTVHARHTYICSSVPDK